MDKKKHLLTSDFSQFQYVSLEDKIQIHGKKALKNINTTIEKALQIIMSKIGISAIENKRIIFIKNILAEIYTDRLTKDDLFPIIEGYNRNTQIAFLLSIASLIGPGINFFTNPSLINLTLGYLIEGTLTSDAISDKEVLKEVLKISSLSIFSSASNAATVTIEEPLKESLISNSHSS